MSLSANNNEERQVLDWLSEHREDMLTLLCEIVNIDSGTYDKVGVDAVGGRLRAFFESHGLVVEQEHSDQYGDALHVQLPSARPDDKPVLLLGHRDTVFPKGEAAHRPFRIADGRAYGPGVADMKAGLVMNAFVLAALHKVHVTAPPVAALITGDEEVASPFSRAVIERMARKARCVFNAEPGRPNGAVVIERKGAIFARLSVSGRAAHSGANFEMGISAIEELAHKILALHALTDLDRGLTVNVGLVRGGQSINTTAPNAEADIDVRYRLPEDAAAALQAMRQITDHASVTESSAILEVMGEFLPVTRTAAADLLFAAYRESAAALGMDVDGIFSGGGADSGFTAGVGCPTLCSVGPLGGHAHTIDEFVMIDTLLSRAQTLAMTILRLPDL